MKKIYTIAVASTLALSLAGCATNSANSSVAKVDITRTTKITPAIASKLDARDVCNVKKRGITEVILNARIYNNIAKKDGVEYRRLGVNNTDLIKSVEAALVSGAKVVNPKDHKGKPSKTKLDVNFAAWRACTFGLNALQSEYEAQTTYKDAIPGDGFKY